jgi:uncharacterized membrane protein
MITSCEVIMPEGSLPLSYTWLKLLHLLGVVLFMGNLIVTGVWMLLAERTKDPATLYFASKTTSLADLFFTLPGIVLILFNGMVLSIRWGGIIQTSWITAGLALFGMSGLIWMAFLLRYQRRLIRIAGQAVRTKSPLPDEFFRILHRWYFWGTLATILPLITMALMVLKPKLW